MTCLMNVCQFTNVSPITNQILHKDLECSITTTEARFRKRFKSHSSRNLAESNSPPKENNRLSKRKIFKKVHDSNEIAHFLEKQHCSKRKDSNPKQDFLEKQTFPSIVALKTK